MRRCALPLFMAYSVSLYAFGIWVATHRETVNGIGRRVLAVNARRK